MIRPILAAAGFCLIINSVACSSDDSGDSNSNTNSNNTNSNTNNSNENTNGNNTNTNTNNNNNNNNTTVPDGFCDTEGSQLFYDPHLGFVDAFPDDFFTTTDASTETGIRVNFDSDTLIHPGTTAVFDGAYEELNTQDGFGASGEIFMRFEASILSSTLPAGGAGSGSAAASLVLVDLDATPIEFVDFTWRIVDDSQGSALDQTLIIAPLKPLAEQRHYGVAMTTAATDNAGDCIAPSGTMGTILANTAGSDFTAPMAKVQSFIDKLVTANTISAAADLTAAFTFTTQTVTATSADLTAQVRGSTPVYTFGSCTAKTGYDACTGTLGALDFRGSDGLIGADDIASPAAYNLPINVFLPQTGTAPYPVVLYSHGLGGSKNEAELLAQLLSVDRGGSEPVYAVVAIDAPEHGTHPDCTGKTCPDVLAFFGGEQVGFSVTFTAGKFRDNMRQSNLDKQHVVDAILAGIDANDDTTNDLDGSKLHYMGVSLGGIMAGEHLAMTPEYSAALVEVPGARLIDVVRENAGTALDFVIGSASDAEKDRIFTVVQHVLDAGDPAPYLPHVLEDRIRGTDDDAPHILMQAVLNDSVVPNTATVTYANALGLPILAKEATDIHFPVPGAAQIASFPVSANIDSTITAGFYQFDIMCDPEDCSVPGTTVAANHEDIALNAVSYAQALHFLDTLASTGTPEIIDSYRTLGVKP